MARFHKTLLFAVALILFNVAAGQQTRRTVDEASVIVAYLYNFGKFVEWPEGTFMSPDVPVRFCFYGADSLGAIADSLQGKPVGGHAIEVARIRRGGEIAGCHVLYVDVSERLYMRPLLNLVEEQPVLTVSEAEGFAAAGGVIGLVYADSKLKFEINVGVAEKARLHLSSQLLKLAVDVIGEAPR